MRDVWCSIGCPPLVAKFWGSVVEMVGYLPRYQANERPHLADS